MREEPREIKQKKKKEENKIKIVTDSGFHIFGEIIRDLLEHLPQ
jgi:hypothetical protein